MNTQEKRTEELRIRIRPVEAKDLARLARRDDESIAAVVRRAIREHVVRDRIEQEGA
jgi:hypothetical protein